MRSNLEQITWELLPPVLTQNAKQFRTNYLAAAAATIMALNVKQFRTNYLAAAATGIDTKSEAI
jgi:hypothetical protein